MYQPIVEGIDADQTTVSQPVDLWSIPRQYKPVYHLSASTSRSNLDSPHPAATTKTPLRYHRRRLTAGALAAVDPLHSAATVASSDLTASTSTKSVTMLHPSRAALAPRIRSPSRIPTPIMRKNTFVRESVVVKPATKSNHKENASPAKHDSPNQIAQPVKSHRLMGPVQPPAPLTSNLTKSKTMSMISTLTSSLSRSTSSFTLTSSRSMNLSSSNLNALTTRNRTSSRQSSLADLLPDLKEISKAMPTSYWAGRYVALHDRLNTEFLALEILDSHNLQSMSSPLAKGQEVDSDEESVDTSWDKENSDTGPSATDSPAQRKRNLNTGEIPTTSATTAPDRKQLAQQVFMQLGTQCRTDEARKSLRAFQQAFARRVQCEDLLPPGGSMVDKGSVFAKAGRLFSGSRKSSFGLGRGRRDSAAGAPVAGVDGGPAKGEV
ncbi:MAG: hypothetical protein M1818_000443 [Claussenomyces sp. TS43310]|nr:MAG: hypothetical protein M1818_000443 [Claussenomyces sp. TS43310]